MPTTLSCADSVSDKAFGKNIVTKYGTQVVIKTFASFVYIQNSETLEIAEVEINQKLLSSQHFKTASYEQYLGFASG